MTVCNLFFLVQPYPLASCTVYLNQSRRVWKNALHLFTSCRHHLALFLSSWILLCRENRQNSRPCIDFHGLHKNKYLLLFCPQVVKGGHYVQPSVMHIIWWGLRKGTEEGVDGLHLDQFKYLVMPFALTNVPVVFQALINNILQHFMSRLFIRLTSWFSPGPPKNMDLMLRQVLLCLSTNTSSNVSSHWNSFLPWLYYRPGKCPVIDWPVPPKCKHNSSVSSSF